MDLDPAADTAYLTLGEASVGARRARRVEVDPWLIDGLVSLDFDDAGHLIGIEIGDASHLLSRRR